jgi:hypothetical protein
VVRHKADRPYGEFYDFYSVSPEYFGNALVSRGELSYLAPLGGEKISAPYFKQCLFRGGGYYPPG